MKFGTAAKRRPPVEHQGAVTAALLLSEEPHRWTFDHRRRYATSDSRARFRTQQTGSTVALCLADVIASFPTCTTKLQGC